MGELQPRMRAGDRDRQRVVELLGKHFGEGRLTIEEFDERTVRAHGSVYLDELPALTADLPGDPEPYARPARSPMRGPSAVLVVLLVMLLAWSLVTAVIFVFILTDPHMLAGPWWWPLFPILFVTPLVTFSLNRLWVFA